ncbi:MAG: ribonuclease P protein component [Neisseriaceae bacterium]|nr:MAG: ribonuclease P protein component [Neisseriaceae bacterium]
MLVSQSLSLKKSDKLLNKSDFSEVFKYKKTFNTEKNLRIFYYINNQNQQRFGLIVSKRVSKKAVDRNYMKRLIREWFRYNRSYLPRGDYIFCVKNQFSHQNFYEVNRELDHFKSHIQKKFYGRYTH